MATNHQPETEYTSEDYGLICITTIINRNGCFISTIEIDVPNHSPPSSHLLAKKQTSMEMSLLQADLEWQTAPGGRSFPAAEIRGTRSHLLFCGRYDTTVHMIYIYIYIYMYVYMRLSMIKYA